MLTRQRHHAILTLLQDRGAVTAAELASAFGVSDGTIRRDLLDLHGRGLLHRVHGGAVRIAVPDVDAATARERRAIARLATAAVPPGATIALSAGPTTVALARALTTAGLTVITNSVPVATAAHSAPARPDLLLIGGEGPAGARRSVRWRAPPSSPCTSRRCTSTCTACTTAPASPRPTCSMAARTNGGHRR
jgi:DeoR/GlpR family transcriptional regulator of sugar metabolism